MVPEDQSQRRYTHGRPIAVRTAGEILLRDTAVVPPIFHRFQYGTSTAAVTPRWNVVRHERSAKMLLDDLAVTDQCFGDTNRHLSVVGVPDFFLRILDQGLDRREALPDGFSVLGLELASQGVTDGQT